MNKLEPPLGANVALNCIIDDSALLAGLKHTEEDGLKQWVGAGAVNLYVPLCSLEKLRAFCEANDPLAAEAKQALVWLDHITSATQNIPAGCVQLQGPEDQYETWKEVEAYSLPDTPFSMRLGSDADSMANDLQDGLSLATSIASKRISTPQDGLLKAGMDPRSPPFSPGQAHATLAGIGARPMSAPRSMAGTSSRIGTASIPVQVRPLLNYVVWRSFHRDPAIGGSTKYILLTNDPLTQKQAQKFGVRAKLLPQIRNVVARHGPIRQPRGPSPKIEDNFANRPAYVLNGPTPLSVVETNQPVLSPAISPPFVEPESADDDDDDFEQVVFKPSNRPGSSRSDKKVQKVLDPDHFGRGPLPVVPQADNLPQVPKGPASQRGISQGPHAQTSNRGRGSSRARARGFGAVGRGEHAKPQPVKAIDPDSFARPQPNLRRGRAGLRGLWNPET